MYDVEYRRLVRDTLFTVHAVAVVPMYGHAVPVIADAGYHTTWLTGCIPAPVAAE